MYTQTKPTTRPIDTSFRTFSISDLDSALLIEIECYPDPWTEGKFIGSLSNKNTIANIVTVGDTIVGYCFSIVCVDYADILNICIHPDYQRMGLGSDLLDYQTEQLLVTGIKSILLEVRESNLAAMLYYEKNGFEAIDRRNKYYRNGEDAIIMRQLI
jgi:ribosomal-protein-alanine N-acetyltransferase